MKNMVIGWRRYFNNYDFHDSESIEDLESLAFVVQEFLYTEKAGFENFNCIMNRRIKLYDFMSLVFYFLNPLYTDFAKSTITGYLTDLQQMRKLTEQDDTIEYANENKTLVVYNASSELIVSILWTVYIISYSYYITQETESWKNKTNMLYGLIRENYPYVESMLKEQSPLKYTKEAMGLLANKIHEKNEREKQAPKTNETKDNGTENLEARIAELEEKCKQQEEKIKEYEEAAESIDLHDKIRLGLLLRLLKNDGANIDKHGNKTKAAQIMQSITGLPLQTCKNYCSEPNANTKLHGEEVLKINALLQALDMEIRL